ncbi:MAG: hypothetical protein V1867_06605 [Candidatus Falkowbacteria bacterium]
MEALRRYGIVLAAGGLLFLFSGCSVTDSLRRADDKAGEMFNEFGIETEAGTSTEIKLPDIDLGKIGQSVIDLKNRFFPGSGLPCPDGATSSEEAPAIDREKLEAAVVDAKDLTREAKDAIDAWLATNGLNRYGDPIGTYYAGGTPLFNEMTGEAIDRFEYILEKRPEIFKKINN